MTEDEAAPMIVDEWRSWSAHQNFVKPSGTEALLFFGFLQRHRPDLLSFHSSGDKWQIVKSWLLRANCIS